MHLFYLTIQQVAIRGPIMCERTLERSRIEQLHTNCLQTERCSLYCVRYAVDPVFLYDVALAIDL